ncbi:DUF3224 domain-containing protein [Dictyobacter aurantiacus]|nr:DUF3224 domain-containing protein [Dictyobacter aurantiacus]
MIRKKEDIMGTQIKAEFQVISWQETPYDEPEQGAKLLRVAVKKSFRGPIEAESSAELLMCQGEGNSAGYVASERVSGSIEGRTGTFVIQHGGAMVKGQPDFSFGYVVPGSGTGALQGLRGSCAFQHDDSGAVFTLDYFFE